MSSSTYTPNLGIEQPATGAYANTWGNVANRSYAVLDSAIGGNAQVALTGVPGLPQQLVTTPGSDGTQHGLFPLIIWTGPQQAAGAVLIVPATQQRLFIMRNQTLATIAFSQSSGGSSFTLQPGYDAHIYCDAASPNANVAAAILNPQYNNVLVTGTLTIQGNLTGNLNLGNINAASLGLGSPTSVPDPLTINGVGSAGQGQLRLVAGANNNYGVLLFNSGNILYFQVTGGADPYGVAAKTALEVDLAGGGVTAIYGFAAPTIQSTGPLYAVNTFTGNLTATGSIMVDALNTNVGSIDIAFGASGTEGIGSARSGPVANSLCFFTANAPRILILNTGLVGIGMTPTQALTVHGYVYSDAGIMFPDGSIQTTAISGTLTSLQVNGNANITGTLNVGGVVTVANDINITGAHSFKINGTPLSTGITGISFYYGGVPQGYTEAGINISGAGGAQVTFTHAPGQYGGYLINVAQTSDVRVKRNVHPLEGGLSILNQLHPIEGEYNGLGGTREGERVVGVMADELQQILPGCVVPLRAKLRASDAGETDILTVDTRELIFQLILAVQQLSERLGMNKAELA